MTDFDWPGWHLLGRYESDVGSWLLHHDGEAALLELPEGLSVSDVRCGLRRLGATLRYILASHDHPDHLDTDLLSYIEEEYPDAQCIGPAAQRRWRSVPGIECLFRLAGEPLWIVEAPKHSLTDVVTVFRGVAMTGDIELETLDSVTDEVPLEMRRRSMARLSGFPCRHDYHVHTVVSAHLDDVRTDVNWPDLFRCRERAFCS